MSHKTIKLILRGDPKQIDAVILTLTEFFQITHISKINKLMLTDDWQRVVRIVPPEVKDDDEPKAA